MRPNTYNPYTNQPQIPPVHYKANKAYNKPMFSGNPYTSGYFQSLFNQQQTQIQTIDNEVFDRIPMFGPNGDPMNKAAEELAKTIDCRIMNHEKTKARNRRKAK